MAKSCVETEEEGSSYRKVASGRFGGIIAYVTSVQLHKQVLFDRIVSHSFY
jgi:hypothetical protein